MRPLVEMCVLLQSFAKWYFVDAGNKKNDRTGVSLDLNDFC